MIADAGLEILRIVESKPGKDVKKSTLYIMIDAQEHHSSSSIWQRGICEPED